MWTWFSSLAPEPEKWLSREDGVGVGQTLLPVSKFLKAHGGNFVVSFLVEVVDFITMWFYFHCTRCCRPSPPVSSDALCTPVPRHRALNLPHWSVLCCSVSMQRQQTNHPLSNLLCPLPWEHLLFEHKCLSLCRDRDFSAGGVTKAMVCSSTERDGFWPWYLNNHLKIPDLLISLSMLNS